MCGRVCVRVCVLVQWRSVHRLVSRRSLLVYQAIAGGGGSIENSLQLSRARERERELARGGPTSLGSCVPSSWSWRTVACVCVFVVWWIVGWGVDGRRLVVKERVR